MLSKAKKIKNYIKSVAYTPWFRILVGTLTIVLSASIFYVPGWIWYHFIEPMNASVPLVILASSGILLAFIVGVLVLIMLIAAADFVGEHVINLFR